MSFKHLLINLKASVTSFLETVGSCLFHIFLSGFRFFVLKILSNLLGLFMVCFVLPLKILSNVIHPG